MLQAGPSNGKTVLVVDDASVARVLLRQVLGRGGYTVIEAESGQDAIRMFSAHRPDVVTMDILMDAINGMVAIQALMRIDPNARIVVISATSDPNVVTQSLKLGVRGFVSKPFQPANLLSALQRALE